MLLSLLPAFLIFLVSLVSPGPDFAITLRNSVRYGWRAGVLTAVGIALALSIHLTYINIGLGALIANSIVAFNIMKYAAAAYLIYIGYKALRSKPYTLDDNVIITDGVSGREAFWQGFVTNALNPKAAMFFLSLFTIVLQPNLPIPALIAFSASIMMSAFIWFSLVAFFFTRQPVRTAFLRTGHWFDRAMGGLLVALGIKVALSSR
jgi:RhtB (resistance to homoserine/threonine) family protein